MQFEHKFGASAKIAISAKRVRLYTVGIALKVITWRTTPLLTHLSAPGKKCGTLHDPQKCAWQNDKCALVH